MELGNLRYIKYNGNELIRAISFIIRDKDWGTYTPYLSDIQVKETEHNFQVSYKAEVKDDFQSFLYSVQIIGNADGTLIFSANGQPQTDFITNRTGFVILHPIVGISGQPVEVMHTNGDIVSKVFPDLIDPVQPMVNLRSLTHTSPSGLQVECIMEGDTFEMEDQRNWTDASYKTYVRPLSRRWPYTLKIGEKIEQKITVNIQGKLTETVQNLHTVISTGKVIGTIPPLGQGLYAENTEQAINNLESLQTLNLSYLILHYDIREGHNNESLEKQIVVAKKLNADLWLEAIIESVDDFEAEVWKLAKLVHSLGVDFSTILVSPAVDLKCTLPGSTWPDAPNAEKLYNSVRSAFPNARIGGGMFSYFTELNRKRPPASMLDMITFTTCPIVHMGDDYSIMETRESYPAIIKSAKHICKHTPFVIGPSAIGMRDNPYGNSAKYNPENIRQAMNWNDPRQRGLFGAVWNLGYFAEFSKGGAKAIALGAPVGPFGLVYSEQKFPQPWYEENKGLYPVFHVIKGLSTLCGHSILQLKLRDPIIGIAAQTHFGIEIWLGNTTAENQLVHLETQYTERTVKLAILNQQNFSIAATQTDFMDQMRTTDSTNLSLGSYNIVRMIIAD